MKPGGVMVPAGAETSVLGDPGAARPCRNPECSEDVHGPAGKLYCGPACANAMAHRCKAIPRRAATPDDIEQDRRAWHERRAMFTENPFRDRTVPFPGEDETTVAEMNLSFDE